MKIRYTIKIKDKHNPPDFKFGKGVVATQVCSYKDIKTEKDLKNISFQIHVLEWSKKLLEEYFEVVPEVVDIKKERKEKLKKLKDV
jgi:hypothetical protein